MGWYIGPSLENYRRYKLFVTETISEIIADVVEFTPHIVGTPRVSSADAATLVLQLKNPTPNSPFETINETHHASLMNLAELENIIPKGAEQ